MREDDVKDEVLRLVNKVNSEACSSDCNNLVSEGLLDSVELFTLVDEIENAFNIEISPEYLDKEHFDSIDNIAHVITTIKDNSK